MPPQGSAPVAPGLPWRFTSSATMGVVTTIAKGFLYGLNNMEVTGLEGFLEILDRRKDIEGRQRGLLTGKRTIPSSSASKTKFTDSSNN